jgi:hypothetical protein
VNWISFERRHVRPQAGKPERGELGSKPAAQIFVQRSFFHLLENSIRDGHNFVGDEIPELCLTRQGVPPVGLSRWGIIPKLLRRKPAVSVATTLATASLRDTNRGRPIT